MDLIRLESFPAQNQTASHLPEEVKRQDDLEGRRPDHVDVRDQVHETLCVDRHEVHDFSDRRRAASRVRNHQRLK